MRMKERRIVALKPRWLRPESVRAKQIYLISGKKEKENTKSEENAEVLTLVVIASLSLSHVVSHTWSLIPQQPLMLVSKFTM